MSANVTGERLLPSMNSFVILEISISSERIATDIASEGSLSGVNASVAFHGGTLRKSSTTEVTLKGLLPCMYSHMFFQVSGATEFAPAHTAHVRLDALGLLRLRSLCNFVLGGDYRVLC